MERYGARERIFAASLSALAGYVDAVGFVQSKGFFVSFMSGNSTRFGVGLAESAADALAAAGLLIAFILGVTTGSLVGRATKSSRVPAILMGVGTLLAAAAALGLFGHMHAALAVTAFAMGAENATLEQRGRIRVGVTYMTGSVVKVGQVLADRLSGDRSDWVPAFLLWAGFLAGAAAGAVIASRVGFNALWVGSIVALALAIVGRTLSDLLVARS